MKRIAKHFIKFVSKHTGFILLICIFIFAVIIPYSVLAGYFFPKQITSVANNSTIKIPNSSCSTPTDNPIGGSVGSVLLNSGVCSTIEVKALVGTHNYTFTGRGDLTSPYLITIPTNERFTIKFSTSVLGNPYTSDYLLLRSSFSGSIIDQSREVLEYTKTFNSSTQTEYFLKISTKSNGITCMKYIKILITPKKCSSLYLHVISDTDGSGNYKTYFNQDKKEVVIQGSNIKTLIVVLSKKVDNWDTENSVVSDWTATKPNSTDTNPASSYVIENVAVGQYTVTAKANDSNSLLTRGCTYTVKIKVEESSCANCGPGGVIDGGAIDINIYNSEKRLLLSKDDGPWEKEPALIEVVINQRKIDAAFNEIDDLVNEAIENKKKEYESKFAPPDYTDINITSTPTSWNSKTNILTKWPISVSVAINGPGDDLNYTISPKLSVQEKKFTGTTVPTVTTWRKILHAEDYVVEAQPFEVEASYKVRFKISYKQCKEPDEVNPTQTCTSGTETGDIGGKFIIKVKGNKELFEVYEPNAKGVLLHTSEWKEKHNRDRYTNSDNSSYYAGETIITHMILEERHKHPFSMKYPTIISATVWMDETGGNNTELKNSLSLVQKGLEWVGPSIQVPKLGAREDGLDTALMGHVWNGLQRGAYAVYFLPTFKFEVEKGYSIYQKNPMRGNELEDYKTPITILGNAVEWQAYRTHYR